MTTLTLRYLTSHGYFRDARGKVERKWPMLARNNHDEQSHSLRGTPVFPIAKPQRFRNWEDYLKKAPDNPPESLPVEGYMMVCEDGGYWPLMALNTDEVSKGMEMEALHEEVAQRAQLREASKDTHFISIGFMVIVGAVAFVTALMGFVVVAYILGGG